MLDRILPCVYFDNNLTIHRCACTIVQYEYHLIVLIRTRFVFVLVPVCHKQVVSFTCSSLALFIIDTVVHFFLFLNIIFAVHREVIKIYL